MDDLTDSSERAHDPEALRAAIKADGYVFCRGLLDRDEVLRAGTTFLGELQRAGWLQPGPVDTAPIALPLHPHDVKTAWTDPGYRAFGVSDTFNRLPYQPRFRALMRTLMANTAFSYPLKVLRVVYPESMVPVHGGRYVHQDYGVLGVQDMFTTWTPLQDISRQRGGLCIRPGSQQAALIRPHLLQDNTPGWLTADYRAGDVLIFHCLTAHAALPNRSDHLRISGEFRWQLADDPVPRHLILGPALRARGELFARAFRRQRWWQPVPRGLRLIDRPPGSTHPPPGPSRYVDVAASSPITYDYAPH